MSTGGWGISVQYHVPSWPVLVLGSGNGLPINSSMTAHLSSGKGISGEVHNVHR